MSDCVVCGEPFTPVKVSYDRVCVPCSDEKWKQSQPKPRPLLEQPRIYTCSKCKQSFSSTFDSKYPELMKCSDCMVFDIMRYADTFGVD